MNSLFGYLKPKDKEKDNLKNVQKYWRTFETFYTSILSSEKLSTKPKIINKPEIKESLKKLADIIIEEDKANRESMTIGDWLEYFLKHHIFETLIAYCKSDKPPGFFNFGMNILIEILENVECTSLISQKSVHPAINQILQMFEVASKDQTEFKYYSNQIIIDFLHTLCWKVSKEQYVVNLLFTNSKRIISKPSDKGDYLPIKVIMRFLQMMTVKDDREYCSKIYETLKIILKMNNKAVDEYINNEGELCEILVNTFDRFYKGLPQSLQIKNSNTLSIEELIKENFPTKDDKNGFLESYK